MTTQSTVTLLPETVEDLQRLEDFAIEHELASEPPLLSWSPYSCRRAKLGNGRSRELIVPFGGTGCIVVFEIVSDVVVVGAVRHQREEDYRH